MKPITLLIMDDSEAVCRALSRRLQMVDEFNIVQTSANGHSPQPTTDAVPVDVAVVGLTRGSRANLKETKRLIESLVGQGTAVLVLSPFLDISEGEIVRSAGASRYLLKAIDAANLVSQIKAVALERHSGRQADVGGDAENS